MITIKTESQIEKMRKAGALLKSVLDALRAEIQPGVTTLHLDKLAERLIRSAGALPSFKGYNGFPFSICASVDDQVVHGFSNNKPLKQGQLLSVDCGVILNGWQSDSAFSVLVGGGAIVLPHELAGTAEVDAPEHAGCANAIGSAISKVSGTYEALVDYDVTPRDEALAIARAAAVDAAVEAGAVRDTVEIIDAEDVPLAYYPGHTNRVKVKAAGDLG